MIPPFRNLSVRPVRSVRLKNPLWICAHNLQYQGVSRQDNADSTDNRVCKSILMRTEENCCYITLPISVDSFIRRSTFYQPATEHTDKQDAMQKHTNRHSQEGNLMPVFKLILTATEAAAAIGYSTQTIYKYIRTGKLPAYRETGHRAYQIIYSDLQGFVATWKTMKIPAV